MRKTMQTQVVSHSSVWSELHTVTTFDAGTTLPAGNMSDKNLTLSDVKSFSPSSLLVESLIEHLCRLLEKDPTNQQNLYKTICGKLHQMKLIDQTYRLEEFESLRSYYQKALLHLVSVAKSTVNGGDASSIIKLTSPNLDVSSSTLKEETLLNWSRYATDYVELEFIAKGGFGQVFKVRHKLDGEEYAVKKIFLRYRNLDNFYRNIQEVKLLAKLNHPNIVSYKAAWLEPLYSVATSESTSQDSFCEDGSPTTSHMCFKKPVIKHVSTCEESSSIVFRESDSEKKSGSSDENMGDGHKMSNSLHIHSKIISEVHASYVASVTSSTKSSIALNQNICSTKETAPSCSLRLDEGKERVTVSTEDKALCRFIMHEGDMNKKSGFQHEWAVLYIQMQLCSSTLRDWLDERNTLLHNRRVDFRECLLIFHDIVSGVEYIHSQGIVHHDIKPSNIFVKRVGPNKIQVGDFGLACFLQHSQEDITLITSHAHRGEIGTKLYAAPEQLAGKCDMKSDIFSLGIILFELLCPFNTDMERSLVLAKLKTGYISPDVDIKNPTLMQLLRSMLYPQPQDRPTAHQVIENVQCFLKIASCECATHENKGKTLESRQESIEQLREELVKKELEVEELRKKVQALESGFQ